MKQGEISVPGTHIDRTSCDLAREKQRKKKKHAQDCSQATDTN